METSDFECGLRFLILQKVVFMLQKRLEVMLKAANFHSAPCTAASKKKTRMYTQKKTLPRVTGALVLRQILKKENKRKPFLNSLDNSDADL